MKKLGLLLAGAALMIGMAASSAVAIPISGSINFLGLDQLTGPTLLVVPSNATGVNFLLAITGSGTGSYSSVPSTAVTMVPSLTFSPFVSPVNNLWSFVDSGLTYSFDLFTVQATNIPSSVLSLQGTGMLHITGFDSTPGEWVFSTTDLSGGLAPVLTFTASAAAVPEPGTMVLLGIGMLGLAVYGKRRMNKEA